LKTLGNLETVIQLVLWMLNEEDPSIRCINYQNWMVIVTHLVGNAKIRVDA